MRSARAIVVVVALAAIPACRGCGKESAPKVVADDPKGAARAPATIEEGCAEVAKEICALTYRVFDDPVARFGDEATCRAQNAARCIGEASSSASNVTTETLARCANALAAAGAEWFDTPWSEHEECATPPGKHREGEACAQDGDCATGACELSFGDASGCGVCAHVAKEGESCAEASCAPGLRCDYSNHTCGKPSSGDTCAGFGCAGIKDCVGGKCVAYGRLGDACDTRKTPKPSPTGERTMPLCDLRAGLDCDQTKGLCVKAPAKKKGERCGFAADPAFMMSICRSDLVCVFARDDAGVVPGPGTCAEWVPLGGACNGAASRGECAAPGRCIDGRCVEVRVEDCAKK